MQGKKMIKTEEQYKLEIGIKALDQALLELDAELAKLEPIVAYDAIMVSAKIQGIVNFMRRQD